MAEHVADQEQRARDTDDRGGGDSRGQRERLRGRLGDLDAGRSGHDRAQRLGRDGARARGRDQDEPIRERGDRGDDPGGVLVGEDAEDEGDAGLAEDVAQ